MIRNLLDHKLFDVEVVPCRRKDYWEWFEHLSEDKRDEVLRSWVYGIKGIQEQLYEMLEIAEERDRLNENFSDEQKQL